MVSHEKICNATVTGRLRDGNAIATGSSRDRHAKRSKAGEELKTLGRYLDLFNAPLVRLPGHILAIFSLFCNPSGLFSDEFSFFDPSLVNKLKSIH